MEIERESIFASAIRIFCRTFFGIAGFLFALFAASLAYLFFAPPYAASPGSELILLPDLKKQRTLVAGTAPVILQISVEGVIGSPHLLNAKTVQEILLDSREGLLAGDRVKGILLYIDSPGGSAGDSDAIYRMLVDYKKAFNLPVFAYVDGLCASGGMYIASAADQIYAGPTSIIGSVGVILSPFFNVSQLMAKIGVESKTLKQGLDKDMLSPFRPWVPGEDASLQAIVDYLYNQFVSVVASARPHMDRSKLVSEYGAQVFDPSAALLRGYVDRAPTSYDEALQDLLSAANIDPNGSYQVVQLMPRVDVFDNFFSSFNKTVTHKVDLGPLAAYSRYMIDAPFAYLFIP